MKPRPTAETLKGLEKQRGQTLHSVWKSTALQPLLAPIPAAASGQIGDCPHLGCLSRKLELMPPCSQSEPQRLLHDGLSEPARNSNLIAIEGRLALEAAQAKHAKGHMAAEPLQAICVCLWKVRFSKQLNAE